MSKIEIKITDQELFDNRKLLDKETKDNWLTALRSGEFKKGKGYLRDKNDMYCCLGVFCEIMDIPKKTREDGNYSYNDNTAILKENNPFYDVFGDFGTFNGFEIKCDGHDYFCNGLAVINDNTDTFEYVIEVIEKYF